MKLLSGYNRILAIVGITGLILIGVLFYQTLSSYLTRQLDDHLYEELLEVEDYNHVKNILPAPADFADLIVDYKPISRINNTGRVYQDTTFYNYKKKHSELGRSLRAEVMLNKQPYQITIIASKFENQEQIRSIALIILVPLCILFLILWVVNRFLMRKIWAPFMQLVNNIKQFSFDQEQSFRPVDTNIEEFSTLNTALAGVEKKIRSDYREIKLFTENASHEMMTPLAVINSKLDSLLQSSNLNKEDSMLIEDLYRATSKLTKLNQSLLLLVKIGSQRIITTEPVDLKQLITEKLNYFQELIHNRRIKTQSQLDQCGIRTNLPLLDILINNLLSNAIRHNHDQGVIRIELSKTNLKVYNSGTEAALQNERIFERFYKDGSSEGTGLGLAILKQICDKLKYTISYSYEANMHCFNLCFVPV